MQAKGAHIGSLGGFFINRIVTAGYLPETIAYLTAAGLIDSSSEIYYPGTPQEHTGAEIWEINNDFFGEMIGSGDYDKFPVVYLFQGSAATPGKYNAVNPLDTNAAFRLSFSGGITVTPVGMQGSAVNGYARTYFYPSTHGSLDSGFIFGVSGNIQTNTYDFGAISGSGGTERRLINVLRTTSDAMGLNYYTQNTANQYAASVTDCSGIWHQKRNGNTVDVLRQNISLGQQTLAAYILPTVDIYLLARNVNGIAGGYSPRLYSFWATYNGVLSNPTAVYNAFNNLKTALVK